MSQRLWLSDVESATSVLRFLYPPWWSHLPMIVYSIVVAILCVRMIWSPRSVPFAVLLPHLASAPLLVGIALSMLAVVGDYAGAGPRYYGMGVVWPGSFTRTLHLVGVGFVSFIVLLPLATAAVVRAVRANGPVESGSR